MAPFQTLLTRHTAPPSQSTEQICQAQSHDQSHMLIRQSTFAIVLTICTVLTFVSLLGIAIVLHREWKRRRQNERAKAWAGRGALWQKRITFMRKAVDEEFSSQYQHHNHHDHRDLHTGYPTTPITTVGPARTDQHANVTEDNPPFYRGTETPIELSTVERGMWEVPVVPPPAVAHGCIDGADDAAGSTTRRFSRTTQQRVSLWFDYARGFWVPK